MPATCSNPAPGNTVYYGPAHPPQLFNTEADPHELQDQSTNNTQTAKLDAQLRTILNPDKTNQTAKSNQAARARHP